MSMIEHAVGVVSLDRFAEIDLMDHDEMGSLLLDTMAENAKLRELIKRLYCGYMQGSYRYTCRGCEYAYEDGRDYERMYGAPCLSYDDDEYGSPDFNPDGCWKRKKLKAEMHELGIEVDRWLHGTDP